MKTKKRTRFSRGRGTGTHGGGARKKRKKSGHKGGKGMSGSGKRADHKKTLVNKKHGHGYFGKKGITSQKTQKDKRQRINLQDISLNLNKFGKKIGDKWEINLSKYKILGKGNINSKLIIKAESASKSAIAKVKKLGGEILITVNNKTQENSVSDKARSKSGGKQLGGRANDINNRAKLGVGVDSGKSKSKKEEDKK